MRFNLKMVAWIGFLLTTALFLGGADGKGCGIADDGSDEAKIEKARIALDKGNYTEAVETLKDLCGADVTAPTCDPEIVSLYASAYAGKAGLDTFDLIKEAVDQSATTGATSYTLFSKHFSSPDPEDVGDMNAAVSLLTSITNRTPEQGLQLAVISTVDLVVFLGNLSGGYDTTTGKPIAIPDVSAITLTSVSRVLSDVNDMGAGLDEAGISQSDNDISDHISKIQADLASPNATTILTFLSSI